jgi:hypothetical protein
MNMLINNGNVEITSIRPESNSIHLVVHLRNVASPGQIEHAVNNNVTLALDYLKDEGFIKRQNYMVHVGILTH